MANKIQQEFASFGNRGLHSTFKFTTQAASVEYNDTGINKKL
jgi:hypothetical protein